MPFSSIAVAKSARHPHILISAKSTKRTLSLMKVFVIVTGASQAVGRAVGQILCDESFGVTELRALLVGENLKSLESAGIAIKRKAETCRVLLTMFQADLSDHKGLDRHIDDLLVEISNDFDKILLLHGGQFLGDLQPLLASGSVEQINSDLRGDEKQLGPSWVSVRFTRHVLAHKVADKATIVHLSPGQETYEERNVPCRVIHYGYDFDLGNYEAATVAAQAMLVKAL